MRRAREASTAIPPFQRFLDEHRTAVYGYLRAVAGPNEADDVFQETFLAAFRAYSRLRPGGDLRSWILRIATRKAIDAARRRTRRPVPLAALPDAADGTHEEPMNGEPALWKAVRQLPPKQRAALVHRYVHDLPYARIAELMGGTEDAARANAYQGMRRLRETWEER